MAIRAARYGGRDAGKCRDDTCRREEAANAAGRPMNHQRGAPGQLRPIVIFNTPPEPTRFTLEAGLLESLGAPPIARARIVDHAGVARRMPNAFQTKILVFEEIQRICHTRPRDRAVVLDTIKSLSTTCQASVMRTGTPAAKRDFLIDPQIERRFEITRFAEWKADALSAILAASTSSRLPRAAIHVPTSYLRFAFSGFRLRTIAAFRFHPTSLPPDDRV